MPETSGETSRRLKRLERAFVKLEEREGEEIASAARPHWGRILGAGLAAILGSGTLGVGLTWDEQRQAASGHLNAAIAREWERAEACEVENARLGATVAELRRETP